MLLLFVAALLSPGACQRSRQAQASRDPTAAARCRRCSYNDGRTARQNSCAATGTTVPAHRCLA